MCAAERVWVMRNLSKRKNTRVGYRYKAIYSCKRVDNNLILGKFLLEMNLVQGYRDKVDPK